DLVELQLQGARRLGDVLFTVGPPLGDHRLDLLVLAGMQRLEGEVLELPLELVDTETVRERRVDLQRLARFLQLLLLAEVLDRPLVLAQLRWDHRGAPGMADERLAGAALLSLVRVGGEAECPGEQLPIDLGVVGLDVREKLVEELLVFLARFEDRHGKSVLPRFGITSFWSGGLGKRRWRLEQGAESRGFKEMAAPGLVVAELELGKDRRRLGRPCLGSFAPRSEEHTSELQSPDH